MNAVLARLDRPPLARPAALLAGLGLIGVAIVHLVDGPGSLGDHFYVGALELALTAASVPLAIALVMRPTRDLWLTTAALVCAALLVYVASRTVGLPGSTDDIGNWGEILGELNVAVEVAVIATCGWALTNNRKR